MPPVAISYQQLVNKIVFFYCLSCLLTQVALQASWQIVRAVPVKVPQLRLEIVSAPRAAETVKAAARRTAMLVNCILAVLSGNNEFQAGNL